MPTTYTNGLKLPDLGSIDWFNAYKNNIDILDPIVGTVNGVATTYAPISHNHDASEITSGTIDIARLPPAALERLTTVADQTARYALTTSTVQLGDTVKQLDTGIMYLVVDITKLNSADGYVEYSAGTASKAIADEDGTSIKTGYVNVAGNQTVSGQKTWSGNQFFTSPMYPKNTTYEIGNTPASNVAIPIYFTDKNNVYTGYARSTVYTSGRTATEIRAKNAFKNGVLDPTGSDISSNLNVEVQPSGAKTIYWDGLIRNDVTPYTTNNNSLGTSTNQWSSVYAQTYFYNGTQWGLDRDNTWTGSNTFQTTDIYYSAIEPKYVFKSLGLEIGVQPSWHGTATCYWYDKNSTELGFTRFVLYNNGTQTYEIGLQNKATNGDLSPTGSTISTSFQLKLFKTGDSQLTIGANALVPEINNSYDLGTSTNKWKTLNGVNPGILNHVDASVTQVDIDTTGWVLDGSAWNTFNTSLYMDGWLYLSYMQCAVDDYVSVRLGSTNYSKPTLLFKAEKLADNKYYIYATIPVTKKFNIYLEIKTSGTLVAHGLYPCLGNV